MEDIQIDINHALRHKTKIKWKDEIASQIAAAAIVKHLELCGYEVRKKPEKGMHRTPEFGNRS